MGNKVQKCAIFCKNPGSSTDFKGSDPASGKKKKYSAGISEMICFGFAPFISLIQFRKFINVDKFTSNYDARYAAKVSHLVFWCIAEKLM